MISNIPIYLSPIPEDNTELKTQNESIIPNTIVATIKYFISVS